MVVRLVLLIVWMTVPNLEPPPPESEPAEVLVATIGGKEHFLIAGEPLRIDPPLSAPFTVKVVPTGERLFRNCGMSFRYPAGMRFETDHGPGCRNWTLHGTYSDLDIYSARLSARAFLEAYVESFVRHTEVPQQRPELRRGELETPSGSVTTWQTRIQISADDFFEFFVVQLPAFDGETRMLMFDMEYDGERLTDESETLKTTVLKSLSFER